MTGPRVSSFFLVSIVATVVIVSIVVLTGNQWTGFKAGKPLKPMGTFRSLEACRTEVSKVGGAARGANFTRPIQTPIVIRWFLCNECGEYQDHNSDTEIEKPAAWHGRVQRAESNYRAF